MQILKDIGSYAGIGAVVGLAVLAALYFSQARDVKRLREWAGRAPERTAEGAAAQQIAPQRVTAVPQAKPAPAAQKAAQPAAAQQGAAKPAAAAAAGAATPQARPAAATPAAQGKQPVAATPQAKPAGAPAGDDKKEPVAAEAKDSEATEKKEPAAAEAKLSETEHRQPVPAEAKQPAPAEAKDSETEQRQPAGVGAAAAGGAAASGEAKTAQPSAGAGTAAPVKPGDGTGDGPPPPSPGTPAAPTSPAKPAAATPAGTRPGPPGTGDKQKEPPPVPRPPGPSRPVKSPPSRAADTPSPGPSQTAILPPYGQEPMPWYRRLLANPRHLVLAIVGVLIVGGAAAFGLTELSKKEAPPPRQQQTPASDTPKKTTKHKKATPINPRNVTVSVLNGTTVPGLAAQIGDRVTALGFQLGNVTNSSDQQRAESVVLFAPGAQREAAFTGRKLGIAQREPIDPQSQTLAGDARVVVITGADKTR
jgi:chemotaxis protein histidine kinase CheA